MATWRICSHNVTEANEALRKVTLWSSADRGANPINYYSVTVGIGTSDGKVDVVGEYDGSTDALTGNDVRDLTGVRPVDRLLKPGDTLLIDVESVGSPALTASGLTVEWHLELVGGNSQAFKPAFQVGGYIPDERVRSAVGGLERQLNGSGVTAWTVAVPLQDPVEDSALSRAMDSIFQGRIQRDSATQISLQRYSGDTCVVAGDVVSIGSSGLTCLTTDNLINSSGLNSAGAPAASATLYYVYLIGPQGGYSPNTLRMSTTAPTLTERGLYLGSTGNAVNCRYVGQVRVNATPNFVDTVNDRLVVNYYNRRAMPWMVTPGYADANSDTTYTTTSTTYTAANGGTGATGSFLSNGEDAISFRLWSVCSVTAGNSAFAGIGADSTSTAAAETECDSTVEFGVGCHYTYTPAAGYRTASLLVAVSGGTGTYRADGARKGSSADPIATAMMAEVWG